MNIRHLIFSSSVLVIALFTTFTTAAEPSLKEIMQDLRDNLVKITDGLLVDDFDLVSQGATGIAQHAPIAVLQATRIANELGSDMVVFKQFDEQVHGLSIAIAESANNKDRDAVIVDYQAMVQGCLSCHAAFKERVAQTLGSTL